MRSLFKRRTARGRPGRTEQVLGAILLVLAVAVAGAFALTTGLLGDRAARSAPARAVKGVLGISDRPLFAVESPVTRPAESSGRPRPAEAAQPAPVAVPGRVATRAVAAGADQKPPAGGPRFADPQDADIAAPVRIDRYTDNLYEKIDGREPQFRQFGFVELRVGQYLHEPSRQVLDAYVFDMGEPANAMGIYMTERSEAARALDLGRGGYASGTNVYFWKGRHYVYILGPAEGGEGIAGVSERIARAIEATIPDRGEPFWADKILPAGDRVPDSLSYRASSGLGFDFLKRMFVANYRTGERTYQMYVIRAEDAAAARTLFEKFAEATAKYDTVLSRSASPGGETLVSESLGVFGVAFHKGVYFAGVAECEDRALAEERAAAFRDGLPAD